MMLDDLLALSRPALLDALRSGHPIAPEALADTEYLGVSLGLPGWVDALAWKTFMKTFHRDPSGGLRGWNVRLHQDGLDADPRPILRREVPLTFGHYRVQPLSEDFKGVRQGLMLDYGAGDNGWWDPVGLVRDPVVALHPGRVDLLLGWSTLRLPGMLLSTPSFFALRRVGPLSFIPG